MDNRKKSQLLFLFLLLGMVSINCLAQNQAERPNIVWIVTEDNSKHFLRLYEEGGAAMPNVEALAKEGIVFKNAFSNAPVCSVARSTLISGCYAPRIGAQYHRKMELARLPGGLEMFPYYLKKEGYYTSNNSKEDYNLIKGKEVWDASSRNASYKNRSRGQSFFHVQNFGTTHEGRLHFSKKQQAKESPTIDKNQLAIFPYHPNTPTFQFTYAKYRELHEKVDAQIGEFIDQLKADGLMEDTFIFYYGDHGGVLPRSKGYIYESGLNVPLVVYVPEKWKHLVPMAKGNSVDAFVQFIDFAPTVLNLAGVDIPKAMDGNPFLGKGIDQASLDQRQTAFSYADRFDEKYDLVRALRKGKYKYIRNYQPFNQDGLFNFYRYKMLAYKEWRALYEKGQLNETQQQFFQTRQVEALYDIEKDPHEVNNLAKNPQYQAILKELRLELQQQVKSLPDLSFFPEPFYVANGLDNPVQFGQLNKKRITKLIDIADLSLKPFKKAKKRIKKALKSKDPWQRYWGLIVCSVFGKEAKSFYKKANQLALNDAENLVRTRAIEFLALEKQIQPEQLMVDILKQAKSKTEANLILNTVAMLKEKKLGYRFSFSKDLIDSSWVKNPRDLVSRRLEFINDNAQ